MQIQNVMQYSTYGLIFQHSSLSCCALVGLKLEGVDGLSGGGSASSENPSLIIDAISH